MSKSKESGKAGAGGHKIETRLAHLGGNPFDSHGFVNPPLYRGSTILYPSMEAFSAHSQEYTYGRRGTPTIRALENAVTELEGGAHTVLTSSGLSACGISLLSVVSAGGHVLVTDAVYQPARKICEGILKRLGVEITYFDPLIADGIAELIQDNTQLVYTESPGSQTFEIQDLPAIARAARARDVPVLADNTWATPIYCNPLALGADLVVNAGTKYFSGHSDANLGSITATKALAKQLRQTHGDLGQCPGPEDTQLCLRGLRTISLRLERHWRSALEMADWLAGRPEVARVIHPAREDHPQHDLWKRDFRGASGLFSIILKDCSHKAVAAMLDGLTLFGMGASWGGYESLVIPFDPTPYRTATQWKGEGPALRFHIGLENTEDLKADLDAGFKRLRAIG
ncbi:cystathionine beta-lyase MetC [bacterium BMS3Bbin10]|nr:cystathionine beta-lyase MetC [bacterium BMS3Bbin10]